MSTRIEDRLGGIAMTAAPIMDRTSLSPQAATRITVGRQRSIFGIGSTTTRLDNPFLATVVAGKILG